MDMTLDPNSMLRVTDGRTVVQAVASNPLGTPIAWDWMQREWANIRDFYDTAISSPVGRIVQSVTRSFNTDQELQELNQFYNNNIDNLGTAESSTKTAIKTTEANIDWMNKYYDTVVNWLQNRK